MPITSEITVKPQAFASAVSWAAKWLTARPAVPVQGGLLLTIDGGQLTIDAFSENVNARATIDCEAGLGAGGSRALVSGRLLAELAATFGNKAVTIDGDDSNMFLRAGRFSVSLPLMDDADFPSLPTPPNTIGVVAGDALASAVARTSVAVGKDSQKGLVFTVMHMTLDDDHITLLATDRYRAVRTSLPWKSTGTGTADTFGHVLKDAAAGFSGPDMIEIGMSDNVLSLASPTRALTMRLADLSDRPFPVGQFAALLDTEQDVTAVLKPAELMAPLKRAGLVRGKEGPVRLTLTEGTVTISSKADETPQKGDEEVDAEYQGDEVAVAFNPQYLADALATVPGDTVRVSTGHPRKPTVLTVDGDPTWRHILVPIVIR